MCRSDLKGVALALALLAQGCATVPGLPESATPRPVETLAADRSLAAERGAFPDDRWWLAYDDAALDALIQEGLSQSPDLAAAAARVRMADAIARQARSALLPTLEIDAKAGGRRMSQNQVFPSQFLPDDMFSEAELSGNLSFDIDLWGRNRKALAAALSETAAARVDAAQARNLLTTAIARRYFEFQSLNARIVIARGDQQLAAEAEALAASRVREGIDNSAGLNAARANAQRARGNLAALEEAAAFARNALSALTGEGPDRGLSIAAAALPRAGGLAVPANLPLNLLGRRPDIVSARLHAEAAAARIGVARADFYPSINLSAIAGLQSVGLDKLFESASRFATLGPAVSLPLFDGGARAARYRHAHAAYDEAVARYDTTLVQALRDVADSVASKRMTTERLDAARAEAHARSEAARLIRMRHKAGLEDRMRLIEAERAAALSADLLAQSQANDVLAAIALTSALGGGFYEAGPSSDGKTP